MDITLTDGLEPNTTVNTFLVVDGAPGLVEFLVAVFDGVETLEARTPDRDGTLIHAEVAIGNSTIMLADRKADFPYTPGLTQVYVRDAQEVLDRATARGATVVTPVTEFYGGYDIARFRDSWGNLWWLFAPAGERTDPDEQDGDDWRDAEPGPVYTTYLEAMRTLRDPRSAT